MQKQIATCQKMDNDIWSHFLRNISECFKAIVITIYYYENFKSNVYVFYIKIMKKANKIVGFS